MSPRAQYLTIVIIGLLDLVTTLIVLRWYGAEEANPFMAAALARGTGFFIQVKLALLLVPLAAIEWARRRNPEFVRRAMHTCIAAYLVFYVSGVTRANSPPEPDPRVFQAITQTDVEEQRMIIGPNVISERKQWLGEFARNVRENPSKPGWANRDSW